MNNCHSVLNSNGTPPANAGTPLCRCRHTSLRPSCHAPLLSHRPNAAPPAAAPRAHQFQVGTKQIKIASQLHNACILPQGGPATPPAAVMSMCVNRSRRGETICASALLLRLMRHRSPAGGPGSPQCLRSCWKKAKSCSQMIKSTTTMAMAVAITAQS